MKTAWLLRDGTVLAAADVAEDLLDAGRGLLGATRYDRALYLPKTRSVHSIGMRFPLDVAFVDQNLIVLDVVRLERWRLTRPRRRARGIIEAEAGSFERWGLHVGDRLEVTVTA